MLSQKTRIFATLAYADVFDYPLADTEVWYWMIGPGKKISIDSPYTQRWNVSHQTYITLIGRKHIIALRQKRARIAKYKWQRANRISGWLRLIPSVTLVGVTGGLAMDNALQADDIDLFIVTYPNTMWITRMIVTMSMFVAGVRRAPGALHVENSICLNMFMSEEYFSLPKRERDLFSAHEVLQMRPLWSRKDAYKKFLTANRWVKAYLPNAWRHIYEATSTKQQITNKYQALLEFGVWILRFFEFPSRKLQLWYMQKRRTVEVIERGVLRFHPKDARVWVKEKFRKRLEKINVPLDRIFYHR